MRQSLRRFQSMMLLGTILAACMTCFAQADSSQSNDINSAIESLRADFRADKVTIITQAMQFSDKDSAAFWPIYRRYDSDLSKLNDDRVQIIKTYADKFNNITDADAKDLAEKSFAFDSKRTDLKKKYFNEFNKQLPATTVAKFFQLEHRLDLLVDLNLAAGLPPLLTRPAASAQSSAK
ncbi:MAG TPA: hypothetical protein VNX88_00085 [Terriglobales bacterium]|jgi:hypothetical protein|nr:hypothetical protein [Terriglobales bacterium]